MIWIAAIISFLVGVALAYWLVEKRLNQQKQDQLEQSRKLTEELERSHQLRLQQSIQSLQTEHDAQLRQNAQQLEQSHELRVQEVIQSLQEQHENQLIHVTEEFQRNSEVRLQESLEDLRSQYESELRQGAEQLEALQTQLHETTNSLRSQYESQLAQASEQVQNHEGQLEETTQALRSEYETQLQQALKEFENREALVQAAMLSLEVHYETQLKQLTEELENRQGSPEIRAEIPEAWVSSQPETPTSTPQTNPSTFVPRSQSIGQNLSNEIATWGNSGQVYYIPNLIGYANHQDSKIRALVASAIAKIATTNSFRAEVQRAIPLLGKLSQDSSSQVRLSAVEALGMIQSDQAIPFLQRALRDSDGAVVKSATAAFSKFKSHSLPSATVVKKVEPPQPKR